MPKGKLVLLDLFAEEHPVWTRTEAFYGYPFIWCMLHNFGGNLEMYGALPSVAAGVSAALALPNLIGMGMAPEGIEQNPAVYEFMAEMVYKGRAADAMADFGGWFKHYALRRYGGAGLLGPDATAAVIRAWSLLSHSVYSCNDRIHNTVTDIPTSRPGLSSTEIMGWGLRPHLWYNVNDVRLAWESLLTAAACCPALVSNSSSFCYDLLDVSRELMSKMAGRFWGDVVEAYRAGDLPRVRAAGGFLKGLLTDMDTMLGSHKGFMLGPQIARARACAGAGCDNEGLKSALAALYEWNLRTQVTIWGTSMAAGDSEVSDYANKEWNGLISSFYLPRWSAWLDRLEQDLLMGRAYDAQAWRLDCLRFTYQWVARGDGDSFATAPQGNCVALSRHAYEKYAGLLAPGGVAAAVAGGVEAMSAETASDKLLEETVVMA